MGIKDLGEFGLIDKIRNGVTVPCGITGIGDDCAIIPQSNGMETLVSTDMLIDGVHFLLEDISPYRLGWKSAAVNISDIAAMGGECLGSFLSFALPAGLTEEWIDEFFRGYNDLSSQFDCPLLGGDTTSSPDRLCISVTVLGKVAAGSAVRRNAAKEGDLICVTGCLGDSAAGLKLILKGGGGDEEAETLVTRHYRPVPRVREGKLIAAAGASSMMDISDGIGSDLRHILHESGAGAVININDIPLSDELKNKAGQYGWDVYEMAISGGEDYELLFTIAPEDEAGLLVPHYVIGRIVAGDDIIWEVLDSDNSPSCGKNYSGYRHF